MLVELVKSKIHRVTVTEANLNYVASLLTKTLWTLPVYYPVSVCKS